MLLFNHFQFLTRYLYNNCIYLFVFSAVCIASGITCYTIPQSKLVHNPIRFSHQIKELLNFEIDAEDKADSNDLAEYSNNYMEASQHLREDDLLDEDHSAFDESVDSAFDESAKLALIFLRASDPVFGCSYSFAWIGFAFSMLACFSFATVNICKQKQIETKQEGPKLMVGLDI